MPTIAVQGFGNVGYHFARLAQEAGFKVVAVSDSRGAAFKQDGNWEMEEVLEYKKKTGSITGFPETKTMTNDQLLAAQVDVLVPVALENVINKDNADQIQAKVILEMANGPTTPEADKILDKKEIIVIPDVLANSGGVTVSYFEWVQNLSGYRWKLERVNQELKEHITGAFEEIWQFAWKEEVDLRTAAFVLALQRITTAIKLRGKE